MTIGTNVAELNRLLTQLNVKAALWVGNGETTRDKDGRAQDLIEALNVFIMRNLDFFPNNPPSCSGGCHWDDGLQMCVCDILFAEKAYQAAGVGKAGGAKPAAKTKTKPKAKPKSSGGSRKVTKARK
jgi:hypothetical protein